MNTIKKNWPETEVLNIAVDCVEREALLNFVIQQSRQRDQSCHIVTLNAEMAYAASLDPDLLALLQSADLVIPDGIGVVWALRRSGVPIERLPGVELVQELLRRAPAEGLKFAIWGSHPDTLEALHAILQSDYQNPEVVFCQHGYASPEEEEARLLELAQSNADILLVALGVPRQEQWIHKYRERLNIPVLMGVGGSFDVISGRLERAPVWMRQAHLEWLFRLYQQPSRWRRMLALPKFVGKIMQS